MNEAASLWGGRFREPPAPEMMALAKAETSHLRLVPYDARGSIAHAEELFRAGVLNASERSLTIEALEALAAEARAGGLRSLGGYEDVHSLVEGHLVGRLGSLGAKLRAGRSRNDQAANDLRLYLRAEARVLAGRVVSFASVLIERAEAYAASPCSGFTHLQPAQPVTFGHHLGAHVQPLLRNLDRLVDWDRRSAWSPLGAAALAGSPIAMRPDLSAQDLGYDRAFENSMDAVSARDHVAEFLFVAAMIAVDLSRFAEEVTLWSSRQFGWIELADAYATGSSIMPQKKNPDVAEIARGRAGRLIGDLVTMLTALKGLPLAYDRDLGEDKRASFDAVDVLTLVLPALTGLVRTMAVNVAAMARDAREGFTLATEVADHLALRGVPFAEAHEIAGALVRYCEDMGKHLDRLEPADLAVIDPRLDIGLLEALSVDAAIAARSAAGGTAPTRVREQLERAQARLVFFKDFVESPA